MRGDGTTVAFQLAIVVLHTRLFERDPDTPEPQIRVFDGFVPATAG